MIYRLLKILSQLTIYGYFKKVKIVGREHIPAKGPYIFIANHPSAFMDPIVVATSIRPAVYFIAAGEYVGKGLKGWVFRKLLHMIPVYRPTTRPEDMHKNEDMFVKCFEHLSKRGALLVFPEGVSLTEKKLKPLKTGTVRIAIGAETLENFKLGVPIIPVGLNYSDPHSFRSDLFVKISAPDLRS
ncbi:1-acyl-sn-glycerol-3-phosphate acyltransferase [Crocinitomix sp.]|nr:1-acyl-sn-glycerol-3-phosphate acyltransferase [Crocinitomix sp.]